ncbi:hypothetical protein F4818DRAFT_425050 [Hypoxylon cercidicola]|nr:hypothetical protein F4818DRAFT_425050 [Hypoxylon cercidicola]
MIDLPLPNDLQGTFWGPFDKDQRMRNAEPIENLNISPYIEYYTHQWNAIAAPVDGRYVTVRSHADVLEIIQLLRQGNDRGSIASHLRKKCSSATEDACESSINLAARLLLMMKIGVVKHQAAPRGFIAWECGSLAAIVEKQFNQPQVLDTHHVRLPKSFNAWTINVIGGLQVQFTDNLADHLLLVDDDTKVLIFHHASFLECQQRSLFPEGLVDETLRTLALLFPQSEFSGSRLGRNEKKAWFRKLCSNSRPCMIDPRVTLCGSLRAEDRQIERFTFWRDRLIILKQAYDDATPRTISQWWHDRRNGERWYTFWVAMLVLFITTTLGVVQCVESGLQVYKAYYPTAN